MKDRARDDWAELASLAEVHEQDRPPSRRAKVKAADRLWAEIERLRTVEARSQEKLTAIHEMLPELTAHLPGELAAKLAAHLYVLPFQPPNADDVRRGQAIAAELNRPPIR